MIFLHETWLYALMCCICASHLLVCMYSYSIWYVVYISASRTELFCEGDTSEVKTLRARISRHLAWVLYSLASQWQEASTSSRDGRTPLSACVTGITGKPTNQLRGNENTKLILKNTSCEDVRSIKLRNSHPSTQWHNCTFHQILICQGLWYPFWAHRVTPHWHRWALFSSGNSYFVAREQTSKVHL